MAKVAYLTQVYNPERMEGLADECPWTSWFYEDGQPIPDNAIVVEQAEYDALLAAHSRSLLIAKDKKTMSERARVRDEIVGQIGAANKQRIRDGIWTTPELIGLTQDPEFKLALDHIMSLSFELAQSTVMSMSNPLITNEIKIEIVGILQENLFL